ncbi:MAG TPA: GIY-YIG nuclease family protein [Candidatus Nanoarchaeia archaeon]|nr:GIY-YIG nuclease family protein [Candidatus Nanoarchaeia archaeon]
MRLNKGFYILVINVKKPVKIKIGFLGFIEFSKGKYVYIGSAMNNLIKRIKRHINSSKLKGGQDKKHWHIDYLLSNDNVRIKNIYYKESQEKQECSIAKKVKEESFDEIKGFGSSDCKCESHLFNILEDRLGKIIKGFNKMKL